MNLEPIILEKKTLPLDQEDIWWERLSLVNMKQYFRNRQLCFPLTLEERQTTSKEHFVLLLASMHKTWRKPDYNNSFPPILPHGSQKKRYTSTSDCALFDGMQSGYKKQQK